MPGLVKWHIRSAVSIRQAAPASLPPPLAHATIANSHSLQFRVQLDEESADQPITGRLYVFLSKFHNREVLDRVAVALPAGYYDEPQRRYPVIYASASGGHHVYANSATNGPRGDALVREMIPHVDKTFRTVAASTARLATMYWRYEETVDKENSSADDRGFTQMSVWSANDLWTVTTSFLYLRLSVKSADNS